MACQALFFRACNFVSNNLHSLNTRSTHINLLPTARSLKHETLERLKLLKVPEKPKKPSSPYVRFVTEHRVRVVKENPNLKQTEVIKKCAEDWKNINTEIKEKYSAEYKRDYKIYDEKLQTFNASLTPQQKEALKIAENEKKLDKEKKKVRKDNKETNKPKRPLGPYGIYIMEQSKIKNISIKDLMGALKNEWAHLPEDEKAKYKKEFLKEKERYEKAMTEWESKMRKEGKKHLIRVKSETARPSLIRQLKEDGSQ